jgi:hypothetical protein
MTRWKVGLPLVYYFSVEVEAETEEEAEEEAWAKFYSTKKASRDDLIWGGVLEGEDVRVFWTNEEGEDEAQKHGTLDGSGCGGREGDGSIPERG